MRSSASNIFLVAGREISTKVRKKSFIVGTLGMALLMAVVAFIYTLIGSGEQGMKMLADDDQIERMSIAAQAEEQVLQSLGTTLAGFQQEVAAKTAELSAHLPQTTNDGMLVMAGTLITILLFLVIAMTGSQIAMGVVEEKSSRVVEILLSTMTSFQLMFGKIIGNVVVGLIQISTILLAIVAEMLLTHTDLSNLGNIGNPMFLLLLLVFFFVGYFSFACLYAAFASTVSRMEEVNQAVSPVMMLILVPYFVSMLPGLMGNAIVGGVMKFCPLLSALAMPSQFAQGKATLSEALISLAVSVVFIPVIIAFAAKLYNRSILQTNRVIVFGKK